MRKQKHELTSEIAMLSANLRQEASRQQFGALQEAKQEGALETLNHQLLHARQELEEEGAVKRRQDHYEAEVFPSFRTSCLF